MAIWKRLAVLVLGLGVSGLGSVGSLSSRAIAATTQFQQQEVDQDKFIILAAPAGTIDGNLNYQLLILEQLSDKRPCWSETGSSPSVVDPLLLNFNFTGICGRNRDSNSYSLRTAGQDWGLQYSLRVMKEGNDLVLVAASNTDRNIHIEIGRTYGLPNGFSRIVLNSGWRLTRRSFDGKPVGHVYLTNDQPLEGLIAAASSGSTATPPPPSSDPLAPDLSAPVVPPSGIIPPPPPVLQNGLSTNEGVIPVPSLPPRSSTLPIPIPSPTAPADAQQPVLGTGSTGTTSTDTGSTGTGSAGTSSTETTSTGTNSTGTTSSTGTNSTGTNSTRASSSQPPVIPPQLPAAAVSPSSGPRHVPGRSNSTSSRPPAVAPVAPTNSSRSTGASTGATAGSTSSVAPSARSATSAPAQPPASAAASAQSSVRSGASPSGAPTSVATNNFNYQVIVQADTAELEDKVKAIAPEAFLTTVEGRVVMQAGLFRDRDSADQLQQKLSREGLPTAVIPLR